MGTLARAALDRHGDTEKLGVKFNTDFAFMGSEEAEEDMQQSFVLIDDGNQALRAFGVKFNKVSEFVSEAHVDSPSFSNN